jgi:hypothetical protein
MDCKSRLQPSATYRLLVLLPCSLRGIQPVSCIKWNTSGQPGEPAAGRVAQVDQSSTNFLLQAAAHTTCMTSLYRVAYWPEKQAGGLAAELVWSWYLSALGCLVPNQGLHVCVTAVHNIHPLADVSSL